MSVPLSAEELVRVIRKSGMIDEARLSAYLRRRHLDRDSPADARELADELTRGGLLTYFQAEQFLLGKWRGFTIGKYKLLERLGVGGMGQVFLAEHLVMGKRVAVKVLPPAKADQPSALGRFYREARAAGALDHPNVVRTHDIGQDGNLHYIVMDYVDGASLLDVVRRAGPLDVRRAVGYVVQVAAGLDYAFRNGIIHRDIKPGNILLDRAGVARLLDLGLARFINDHTDQLTVKYDDKVVLGTADYVAPEQVANSHAVDIRADIYGLGATLYFLLAGHPPFPGGSVSLKLLWHRTKEPAPIRSIRPDVPGGLAAVLAKMLAKDPKARYQTPAQVVTALGEWAAGPMPPPRPDEMPQLSPAVRDGGVTEAAGRSDGPGTARETARVSVSAAVTAVVGQSRVVGRIPPAGPTRGAAGTPPPRSGPRSGVEPPPPRRRAAPGPTAPVANGPPPARDREVNPWLLLAAVAAAGLATAILVLGRP
jgi:tRNA A-37 threonylcarbamoyl transferase component Bud32